MANQISYDGDIDLIFNGQNLTKLMGWKVVSIGEEDTTFMAGYNRSIDVIRYNNTCVINKIESDNVSLEVSLVKEDASVQDVNAITSKLFRNSCADLRVKVLGDRNVFATGVFTQATADVKRAYATITLTFETVLPYLHYTDELEFVLNSNSANFNFQVKDNVAKTYPDIIIEPWSNGCYFNITNKTNGSKFYTNTKLQANNIYKVFGEIKQFQNTTTGELIYNKNWVYLDNNDYADFDYVNELSLYSSANMSVKLIVTNKLGFI